MAIDTQIKKKLCNLSRLAFDANQDKDLDKFLLEYQAKLDNMQKCNTDNVEPLYFLTDEVNVFRQDIEDDKDIRQELLKSAPESDGEYFIVPKVLE